MERAVVDRTGPLSNGELKQFYQGHLIECTGFLEGQSAFVRDQVYTLVIGKSGENLK
jgi:hypothetical protein